MCFSHLVVCLLYHYGFYHLTSAAFNHCILRCNNWEIVTLIVVFCGRPNAFLPSFLPSHTWVPLTAFSLSTCVQTLVLNRCTVYLFEVTKKRLTLWRASYQKILLQRIAIMMRKTVLGQGACVAYPCLSFK